MLFTNCCKRTFHRELHFCTTSRCENGRKFFPATLVARTQGRRSTTNALPLSNKGSGESVLEELPEKSKRLVIAQAPNREGPWSRSQQSREKAMTGPRFEQTIMDDQPKSMAAIEFIHKQHVRWTKERVVSCDGGGGPLGHPRIFINVDKPQICWCTYCGIPFAHEHHRDHLTRSSTNSYPLEPENDVAAVPRSHLQGHTGSTEPGQTLTGRALEHR